MRLNNGTSEEKELVALLNQKRYSDLSNNGKRIVKQLFGPVDDDQVVFAELVNGYMKPDIVVKCNEEQRYISMKSGKASVVHQENIMKFAKYLLDKGISKNTIKILLLYHYGDGTLDGSGKKRKTYQELMYEMSKHIKKANDELNDNKELVKDVIERCVFVGTNHDHTHADYVYHGNAGFGVLVSHQQMMKHISRRTWGFMNNFHIGPLQFRPHARYVGKEVKNEESRHLIDFFWSNMFADMDYISNTYD